MLLPASPLQLPWHLFTRCVLSCNISGISRAACYVQISGYITDEDGKKKIALVGKWDSYLDMQKCDEEGEILPGSELIRLWTVRSKLAILVTAQLFKPKALYNSTCFCTHHSTPCLSIVFCSTRHRPCSSKWYLEHLLNFLTSLQSKASQGGGSQMACDGVCMVSATCDM